MATKSHLLFSNFSSGEISPKLDARTDLAQYFNGVQEMNNFVPVQQGGAKTRGGLHFVQETKDSGEARLIPFCFSELQNYMLLFGEQYIWFFMDSGFIMTEFMSPLSIDHPLRTGSPICNTELFGWWHRYLGERVCNYEAPIVITPAATRFIGARLPVTIPYQIESPYLIEDDLWSIRYAQDDENLYLVHPLYPPMVLTKGVGHTSFSLQLMDFIDGPYEDEITSPTITPSATTGDITLTASSSLFLPGHVGALWRLNHVAVWSYVKITGVTSPTVATATVMSDVTVAAATTSHREGAWSDVNGWPRQIGFHEGRMIFASNYEHPQTIWGSKTNEYTDFTPGILDNDAYTFTPSELNIIRWVSSGRVLSIGALNSEATAIGPNDAPITASEPPRIKLETTHGSSNLVSPAKVGNAIIFLQRSNRKIREFVYSFANDSYGAPDLTIASEHLFQWDIIDLIYQQEPDSLLWAIRNDIPGSFLMCSYDRNVDPAKGGIVAWSRHYTDGRMESMAPMPYQNMDQVWVIVNREINGEQKRYVEYYDESISVDSGLTWSGDPVTVLGGLRHLEGKTVQIVGDGAVYPSQVVPDTGEITIDPAASEIYVGIGYTPRLVTNRPEVQTQGGTSQGVRKRWNKVIARILNTTGITINGQVIPARIPADPMGEAPGTFSGDIKVSNLGWDVEGRITIEQPLPLPAHIVAITGTLTVSDD
jgi:hypothetical protein